MADELLDVQATGVGGLDDAPGGGEDDPGLITPQGPVEILDDLDDDDLDDEDLEDDDDWRSELTDEQRGKLAQFGDVKDRSLAMAYLGLESRFGDIRGEIGQLRNELIRREAESGRQQEGAQQGQQQQQVPTMGELAAFAEHLARQVDNADKDTGVAMSELFSAFAGVSEAREEQLKEEFKAMLAERTAPLEAQSEVDARAREIGAIKRDYGVKLYNDHAPAAADLLDQWEATQPGFVRSAGAIRAAFNQAYTMAGIQKAREADAQILEGGGRSGGGGRRQVSASRQVLDEMDEVAMPSRNGGGL